MADAYHHALSSARKFGGTFDDYIDVHKFFDQTKNHYASPRHRAVLHSSFGIGLAISTFGPTIERRDGKEIPTRYIAEQHVLEDCGFIPSIQDWLAQLPLEEWMQKGPRQLSREFNSTEEEA